MKKSRIVLILSAGFMAWLFAQEAMNTSPSNQPAVSNGAVSEAEPPLAADIPSAAVKEVPAVADQLSVETNKAPDVAEEMPAGTGTAEENAASEAAANVDQISIGEDLVTEGEIAEGLISLSLKDVELQDVIRMFSRLSGANIIVPDLQGEPGQPAPKRIDVNLENVEWKPALQAILDTQGLELFEKVPGSEVYTIGKKLPPAQAPRTTRTFVFDFADIGTVATMVKGIVGTQGEVFSYPQGNSIVVKTTQDVMNDVAQVVERVDQPRRQVLIEARIMELSDLNRNARGVNFTGLKGLFEQGQQLVQTGVDVNNNPIYAIPNSGNLVFDTIAGLTEGDFDSVGGLGTLTLSASDMAATLKALQQSGLARVVSNPRVVVANGETANIQILKKIPRIQIKRTIEQTDSGPTASFEATQEADGTDENTGRKRYAEYEFGIRLAVTPTVYTTNNIAVKIVPIITRQSETGNQEVPFDPNLPNAGNNTFLAVDEKRVETQFVLGSRRTAVIGGLTETQNRDIERKVPLLGSIPLLRHLFTYKEQEDIQTENIIFVTVALEDGLNFDIDNAVSKSPLTRQQMVRDESNQKIQDRQVEILKASEQTRIDEEIKKAESKAGFDSKNRKIRKPFWNVLRP